jgi:S-adenosylmethionine:tRNA ribosyltransferase-isomerase
MQASDFDFELPENLIAQRALANRGESRLLVLHRSTGAIEHQQFRSLFRYLHPGDLLVVNNSKVIQARLRGTNQRSGGSFELLLLEEAAPNRWWTMMKPGKRARVGTRITLTRPDGTATDRHAEVQACNPEGHRLVQFDGTADILADLDKLGEIPLPPYIHRRADATDAEHYQTVFGRLPGSVAAPTAGLHFTRATIDTLDSQGVRICEVTLHVGPGTFAPVKSDRINDHLMHEERYQVSTDSAAAINATRQAGGRIVAVGTTTLRTLESATNPVTGDVEAGTGRTRLFIHPPYRFRAVDALLTNFHLPRSTLLMLVCAFAVPGRLGGRQVILNAYAEAVRQHYRFFSYGDAMLIL